MAVKLGKIVQGGNEDAVYSRYLPDSITPIQEGLVVMTGPTEDSVAAYSGAGKSAYGVAGVSQIPSVAVVKKGICYVQADAGISASGLRLNGTQKEAYVTADGKVTDNNSSGVAIGVFEEDAPHNDGEITRGTGAPATNAKCVLVQVRL